MSIVKEWRELVYYIQCDKCKDELYGFENKYNDKDDLQVDAEQSGWVFIEKDGWFCPACSNGI